MKTSRKVALVLIITVAVAIGLVLAINRCPDSGIAFTRSMREFHRLKNRTTFPRQTEFEPAIDVQSLLRPGDDRARWSEQKAARIEGYVVSVGTAGIELTNCYLPCRRDIHINLALRMEAPATEQVVVEVTPSIRAWARSEGRDWSADTLKRTLVGHWCRFEGWLFFDSQHQDEALNTVKVGSTVWRATAWEIHPVTDIAVIR